MVGDLTWRHNGVTLIPSVFSDQCAHLNPLPLFPMLLKKAPQQAGPEPTKMSDSSCDSSINLWLLSSRGHAASVLTTTARKNGNCLQGMVLNI